MTAVRQQPNAAHTNPQALIPGTWDYGFTHRELSTEVQFLGGKQMNHTEQELHDHYASNARACGHSEDCLKVTLPVNWPTMFGSPLCTCGRGEPWIHPRFRAAG